MRVACAEDAARPLNMLLAAFLRAREAQFVPARVNDCVQAVLAYLDAHPGVWGGWGGGADTAQGALLALLVLQGLGGVTVSGGVTEGQYYTTPLGVWAPSSVVLPAAWDRLGMGGLGPERLDFVAINRVLYPAAPLTGGQVAPWSVPQLSF